jgi:ferredoxin-NADP reductase
MRRRRRILGQPTLDCNQLRRLILQVRRKQLIRRLKEFRQIQLVFSSQYPQMQHFGHEWSELVAKVVVFQRSLDVPAHRLGKGAVRCIQFLAVRGVCQVVQCCLSNQIIKRVHKTVSNFKNKENTFMLCCTNGMGPNIWQNSVDARFMSKSCTPTSISQTLNKAIIVKITFFHES